MAWRHDRNKNKRKDRQEEKAGSSEAHESALHRVSGSEDATFHHLQGVSIDLDGVGCGIKTATSTGEG